MSDIAETVTCEQHGDQPYAFLCGHSVASLEDNQKRGLYWSRDGEGHLQGYCDACDAHIEKTGGAWTEANEAFADIRLVCETCFVLVADMNGLGQAVRL